MARRDALLSLLTPITNKQTKRIAIRPHPTYPPLSSFGDSNAAKIFTDGRPCAH